MSTYYDFFAARITEEDMIEAIGPYIRSGEEYRLVPIVTRSRSFIHWDEFGAWALPVSRIPEHQQETFKELGFQYVTLDIQGYRTGSMNETLPDYLQSSQSGGVSDSVRRAYLADD